MDMIYNRATTVNGSADMELMNEASRKFFLSKIKNALTKFRKLGLRPHKDDVLKVTKNDFCTAFFIERMSKNEIDFILHILEKNNIIQKRGTNLIHILDKVVLDNPESLLQFFECERVTYGK